MDINLRFVHAEAVAAHYPEFADFAADGMAFLGFPLTDMQADIADFMQHGPRLRMVMAQRGEAKTTLAALYAVWRIIHRPSTRVLIVSAGEQNSNDTATLIVRLIMTWDILEYLRPDRTAGDRTSTMSFDVHHALKGLDRSPSIACAGITSNLPGRRADLLIPDDVESNKNGATVLQRQQLLQLTKEFGSINTHGDILYLGTPQSKDSIYNTLPGRGFCVRIWPGRFPTPEEAERYGDKLAPFLAERIAKDATLQIGGGLDGLRGKPADPQRYNEEALQEKELDKGPEDFQLQYMLDTTLSDAARQQLKLADFLVANFDSDRLPEIVLYQAAPKYEVQLPADFTVALAKMYHPVPLDNVHWVSWKDAFMFIDPAGGGPDELAYGVSVAVGPYIHVLDVGGFKGGMSDENMDKLAAVVRDLKVSTIRCESNMGHGLFEINLRAELEKRGLKNVGVTGEYSTGQKERRIIDSLVAPLQRHRIVLHKRVFESEVACNKQHSRDKWALYSLFSQINNITTDRNSLAHDDRIEVLAGCVRHWKGVLALDEHKAAEARAMQEAREFISNPMGYDFNSTPRSRGVRHLIHKRR